MPVEQALVHESVYLLQDVVPLRELHWKHRVLVDALPPLVAQGHAAPAVLAGNQHLPELWRDGRPAAGALQ